MDVSENGNIMCVYDMINLSSIIGVIKADKKNVQCLILTISSRKEKMLHVPIKFSPVFICTKHSNFPF